MKTSMRKISVVVPTELLEKAQSVSGVGVAATVRAGLRLVAEAQTYTSLRNLRGKVGFSCRLAELKVDR
jgi:hypothetical protein